MSFLDIIKRAPGAAVRGVGSAVKAAVSPVAEEQPREQAVAAPQDKVSKGFTLPDIDPADPDAAEKQKVHDTLLGLDKQWTENMPDIDYEGHYRKISEDMKKGPKERDWNVLSKLAVAFGTQNPDRPYDENLGLKKMKETSEGKLAEEKSTFEENMTLKKEALSGHIRQLLDRGKFRQALSELNAKEQMGITRQRQEHLFKESEIKAQGDVRKEVAKINAKSAMDRADKRLTYLKGESAKLKLSPSDKAMMDAEYRTSAAGLAEIKKQWQGGMLSDEQVEVAEEEHRAEMKRIHDYWEDREIGERPEDAGPRKAPVKSGSGGGMQPNAADPWFNTGK